jgi:hypothetical protein
MARQYENIISFVKPHGFTLITKKEDYSVSSSAFWLQ